MHEEALQRIATLDQHILTLDEQIVALQLQLQISNSHILDLQGKNNGLTESLAAEVRQSAAAVRVKNRSDRMHEWNLDQAQKLYELQVQHAVRQQQQDQPSSQSESSPTMSTPTIPATATTPTIRSRANAIMSPRNIQNWTRELELCFKDFCKQRGFTWEQIAGLKEYVRDTLFSPSPEGVTRVKQGMGHRAAKAARASLREWLNEESSVFEDQCKLVAAWVKALAPDQRIQFAREAFIYELVVRSVVEEVCSTWETNVVTALKIKYKLRLSDAKFLVLNRIMFGKLDEEGYWEKRSVLGVDLKGLPGRHKREKKENEFLAAVGWKKTTVANGAATVSIRALVEAEVQVCDKVTQIHDGMIVFHVFHWDKAQFHKNMGVASGGTKLANLSPNANSPISCLQAFSMEAGDRYADAALQLEEVLNEYNSMDGAKIRVDNSRSITLRNNVAGDLPSICALYGTAGCTCTYCCCACKVTLAEVGSLDPPEGGWPMRSLAESDLLAHAVPGLCPGCGVVITKSTVLTFTSNISKAFIKAHIATHFGQYPGQPPLVRAEHDSITFCRLHGRLRGVAAVVTGTFWPFVDQIHPQNGEKKQSEQLYDLYTSRGIRVKKKHFKKSSPHAGKFDYQRSLSKHSYTGDETDAVEHLWPLVLLILHPEGSGPDHERERYKAAQDWLAWCELEEVLCSPKGSREHHAEDVRKAAQNWMVLHQVRLCLCFLFLGLRPNI